MKRLALAIAMAGLAAGCAVPAKNMDRVQAGMSKDQVQSIMGQPIAVAQPIANTAIGRRVAVTGARPLT